MQGPGLLVKRFTLKCVECASMIARPLQEKNVRSVEGGREHSGGILGWRSGLNGVMWKIDWR